MMKLSNILNQLDINQVSKDKITEYLTNFGTSAFIYPNRLASKTNISKEKASELLYLMTLNKILMHCSVPMNQATLELYEEDCITGIIRSFPKDFIVQDEDFNEIDPDDLVPVASFKFRA